MTALAALLLLGLAGIQFNWLRQAKELHGEQQHLHYLRTTPELALAIDKKFRPYFHEKDSLIAEIDMKALGALVDSFMETNETDNKTFFALYQDSTNGLFISNTTQYEGRLRNSPYKQCMSCLISFGFATDKSMKKVYPDLTISRPISNYLKIPGSQKATDIIWFSIFVPEQTSSLPQRLTTIFFVSLLMLMTLVGLFYFLLKAFSKHKRMSQVKVDFFNNLNHEFKTPLSSIHLASRVLRQSKDQEKNSTYLDLIERESKTLEERLTRVLELSLLDKSVAPVSRVEVDVHEVLYEVRNRLRMLVDQKNAEVKLSLIAEKQTMQADRTQLSNCFYNLLENALKYGQQGVGVFVSTSNLDDRLQIVIQDTGPGIPKAKHNDVFDRFYRIQKNDSYQGNGFGIGLSYVKAIVESYDGSIRINADYKKGTEFIIEF